MMSENGFGYVEVKDGRVICYIGESNKPDVYIFENDEIVHAVKLQELVKERISDMNIFLSQLQSYERVYCQGEEEKVEQLEELVEESEK